MQDTERERERDEHFDDHIRIFTHPAIHGLHERVGRLEEVVSKDRMDMAVMLNDMTYVKKEVTGISKGINRVLWAIGLSVITALTTFVLSGGITIVQ